MKMLCFYEKEWEKEYIQKKITNKKISFLKGNVGDYPDLNDKSAKILCIFTDSFINKTTLKQFPNIKLIATRSTGFCHIEQECIKSKSIAVYNVPSYGRNTIAEYTFALLLALSRKICQSNSQVKNDCLSRERLQGFDLQGKTIGIIGTGCIGSFVSRIAYGFGMQIIANDIKPSKSLEDAFNVCYVDLEALLSSSDNISLHVPYNKSTHHIINLNNDDKIKK